MKLPPSENERLYAAVAYSLAGSHCVEATLAQGFKVVLLSGAIERDELGLFRDPDRALLVAATTTRGPDWRFYCEPFCAEVYIPGTTF